MEPNAPNRETSSNAPELAIQRQMFPIEVQDIYRNDQGSADLRLIATAMNGKDYAVKTIEDGNGYVPATELFCYELARELSIATPNYNFIKLKDDSVAFGSEWEGGVREIKEVAQIWAILKGRVEIIGLKPFLSRVYALDLFINNIDRHFGNYIFRDSYSGVIALAYDFSRAWYAFEPFGYESLEDNYNTAICHNTIIQEGHFDPETAKNTLDEVSRIDKSSINRILAMIPEVWLDDETKKELLQWWGGTDMVDRIIKLKSGIK